MTRSFIAFALLVFASTASAQDKRPAAAPPPAPTMTAEGKKFLENWRGTWTSNDVVYTIGGQKMTGSLNMVCESVSSGWGTLCKATMTGQGMPPSAGTLLMAWDIATGEGHMFEVMDSAEVHDHSGKWTDGRTMTLVRQGKTVDGKMEKDACNATWVSPRELKFDCTGTQAGATVWTLTSTNRK